MSLGPKAGGLNVKAPSCGPDRQLTHLVQSSRVLTLLAADHNVVHALVDPASTVSPVNGQYPCTESVTSGAHRSRRSAHLVHHTLLSCGNHAPTLTVNFGGRLHWEAHSTIFDRQTLPIFTLVLIESQIFFFIIIFSFNNCI
jgi:hypothetical protein